MKRKRPLKRGDINSDGKVFFGYNIDREIWYEREKFEEVITEYKKKQKEYTRACIAEFNKKPHPPMYTYNLSTKLYYVGRCGVKERWVTEEKLLEMKKTNKNSTKNYVEECRKVERVNYKFGDVNPENAELYFIKYVGNKPVWRDYAGYKKYEEDRKEWCRQCQCKRRFRRKHAIKYIKDKIKKGTCKDDKFFWDYDSYGLEVWVDQAEYKRRCERDAAKQRTYRARRAEAKKNKS